MRNFKFTYIDCFESVVENFYDPLGELEKTICLCGITKEKTISFFKNENYHSDNGPAIITFYENKVCFEAFLENGDIISENHYLDGTLSHTLYYLGNKVKHISFFEEIDEIKYFIIVNNNTILHREDGHALKLKIKKSNKYYDKKYYYMGTCLGTSETLFKEYVQNKKILDYFY